MFNPNIDREKVLYQAKAYGEQRHPDASNYKHCAFANSVIYLMTGASGGFGGPSLREHCVTWSLAGDGLNVPVNTSIGRLVIQSSDGRLPRAGSKEWTFEKACEFAEPICYGILPAIAKKISYCEPHFNDDPEDLAALNKQ